METCKACGAKFEFIEEWRGKTIPAQRVRSIYYRPLLSGLPLMSLSVTKESEYYVSHFETCSSPERFSKKRR